MYAERQAPAEVHTQFSLWRLLDRDHAFRPNLAADRAEQVGAALALRLDRGLDPAGVRWGAELAVEAAAGTFDFVRPGITARLGFPLPGRLAAALELAAGTSAGALPAQSRWYLGGPATVRGYDPLAAGGTAYWRARAELGTALPAARLALFADAGWAGDRAAARTRPSLAAAGIGASFLDGLLRVDVARALRPPTGWRLELYADAAL